MTTFLEIGNVNLRAVFAKESRIKSLQRKVYSLPENRQNIIVINLNIDCY